MANLLSDGIWYPGCDRLPCFKFQAVGLSPLQGVCLQSLSDLPHNSKSGSSFSYKSTVLSVNKEMRQVTKMHGRTQTHTYPSLES